MHVIESKAQPSPPEATMRQERTVQATIFEVFAGHEIGCELKAISQWLDRQRAGLATSSARRLPYATEISAGTRVRSLRRHPVPALPRCLRRCQQPACGG